MEVDDTSGEDQVPSGTGGPEAPGPYAYGSEPEEPVGPVGEPSVPGAPDASDARTESVLDADARMANLYARAAGGDVSAPPAGPEPSALAFGPPSPPPDSALPPPPPPPSPEPRRRGLLLGVVAIAVVLVVAGVLAYVLKGTPAAPSSAVEAAVTKSVDSRTADIGLNVHIHVEGSTLSLSGNGDMNMRANTSNMTLTYGAGGQSIAERLIDDGSTVFINLGPTISAIAPGKSWVSADLGTSGTNTSGVSPGGIFTDPGALLSVLKAEGTAIVSLGASTVDGATVQGYAIHLGPKGIAGTIRSETLPSYLRKELAQVHYTSLDYEVYVDGSQHLKQMRTSGAYSVAGVDATVSGTIDFSDYGTPVTIVDPPANEVMTLQQFDKLVSQDQGNSAT